MTSALEELRFVDSADVWKAGRRAAFLRRRTDRVEFAYDPAYRRASGPPVATTLPVDGGPVSTAAGAVPAFFAGLLPEGRRLSALRRAVKTSADDELSLLLAVGEDVIGDVQVVPTGREPAPAEPRVRVTSWRDVTFAELFVESVGVSPDATIDRIGLPGVQDKVSAAMVAVPVATRDARYILKLNPPEFPCLVENEAFFLDAARVCGIQVPDSEVVHDAAGATGLLVRRFDRVGLTPGTRAMLAQEDGCQVLGRYPADKYNLTTEEVFGGLVRVCRARPVAGRELVTQAAYAYLTGNGDAHAKNFSVVRRDEEWFVTPAYDVPSSYFYDDTTMALAIGGRRRDDISRESFLTLGEQLGVRRAATNGVLDRLVDGVDEWLDRVPELPFDERRTHKFRRFVAYRRDRLARTRA